MHKYTSDKYGISYMHKGWIVSRGSYSGSADDCMTGWYIDRATADSWDRRGAGFRTLAEAKAAIARRVENG